MQAKDEQEREAVAGLVGLLKLDARLIESRLPPEPDVLVTARDGSQFAIEVVRLVDRRSKRVEVKLAELIEDVREQLRCDGVQAYVRMYPHEHQITTLRAKERRVEARRIAAFAAKHASGTQVRLMSADLRNAKIRTLSQITITATRSLCVDSGQRMVELNVPRHVTAALDNKASNTPQYRTAIPADRALWLLGVTGTEFTNGVPLEHLRWVPRTNGFDRAFILDRRVVDRVIELGCNGQPGADPRA